MEAGKNRNHPKKGARIAVEPIRSIKDVKSISKLLSGDPRNNLLFVLGVNNGLRTGDLLRLKVGDLKGLKAGDHFNIRESKTGKSNILVVNKSVSKALKTYLESAELSEDSYLFASRKSKNKPIQIQAVNKLIKGWAKTINLKGNYGAHTLRKTWGYLQRTIHGVGFEIIAKRFNHSNPATTMRYLGIEDKEVHNTLMNEIG
jgi:integrase